MSETTTTETVSYEKGSWQDNLSKSADLLDKSTKARKRAGQMLWTGAVDGINQWVGVSDTDAGAEGLYNEVLTILGTARKGDASKIKTVALAVKQHALDLGVFENLSKAYAEAVRLTKTQAQEKDEDDAAEKAIESIEAPKTTSSVDGAAALLLSKGIDGAVVAILDALGANNEAAHRAFMRAVSVEVAARVQAAKPKPAPKSTTPKAGATKAKSGGSSKAKAAPKAAATKAKPASASRGDANKRALPKPEAVAEAQAEGVGEDVVEDVVEQPKAKPVRRAVPVRRK